MKIFYTVIIHALLLSCLQAEEAIVISNSNVPALDKKTIAKIYTGKIITLDNVTVIPVDRSDMNLKNRFLQNYLDMDNDKYIAYWTVRHYIGKGVAPREIDSARKLIDFIAGNEGAIGYITQQELDNNPTDGIKVLKSIR